MRIGHWHTKAGSVPNSGPGLMNWERGNDTLASDLPMVHAATDAPAVDRSGDARRLGGPMTEPTTAAGRALLAAGDDWQDGMACLHEAINVARGEHWSDSPGAMPDLRSLNDAPWSSDDVRTANLLPVGVALWDWAEWSAERQQRFAAAVAEANIRTILPMALKAAAKAHPDKRHAAALRKAAKTCADEGTESSARSARSATWSAESAASSARSAESATWDQPLIAICRIFVEAAKA